MKNLFTRRSRVSTITVILALNACASGDDAGGEAVDSANHAVSSPQQTPLPQKDTAGSAVSWDRSLVDLMVADAWASCAFIAPADTVPINHEVVRPGDQYLSKLAVGMTSAMSGFTSSVPSVQGKWLAFRNNPDFNRDSSGRKKSASLVRRNLSDYGISIAETTVRATVANAETQARQAVSLAAMNTCIAQEVRRAAMGGDSLRMTEAEQLQSLEVVRERAQIGMLQFAAIFNALARPEGTFPTTVGTYHVPAYLQKWIGSANTTDVANRTRQFKSWTADFADAVQIHLTATRELAELFSRSASADSPRGGKARSDPDQEWGAGSWRQRVLALLYGGDPLAVDADGSTPWSNMIGAKAPGTEVDTAVRPADAWPTKAELPYFTVGSREPQVLTLWDHARRLDLQRVKLNGTVSDIEGSASWMYRSIEAKLRTEMCSTLNATKTGCLVHTLADVPAWTAAAEKFELLNTFGVTKDHAKQLAAILDQYLPVTGSSAVYYVGAVRSVTDVDGTFKVIPREAIQVQRSLLEVAPQFARYSPYRIPQAVDPRVEAAHEEAVSAVTYRTGDDQGLSAGGLYANAMRTFGAVSALSLVRDVLARVGTASGAADLKTALATVTPSINQIVTAGVGANPIRVYPNEQVSEYDWNSNGVPGGRRTFERFHKNMTVFTPAPARLFGGWVVEASVSGNAFFTSGTGISYSLLAFKNDPTTFATALSPAARRYSDGKGIADLAALADTISATATLTNGVLRSEPMLLAEKLTSSSVSPSWTFVVKKTSGVNISYMPLAANLPLHAWEFNRSVSGSVGLLAPITSANLAVGGTLGDLATRLWTVQRANPMHPAFDGFGLRYDWAPSADATAFGSQPGDSVMSYFLRNAKQAAAEATEAVRTAIDSSFRQAISEQDIAAAASRSALVTKQEAQRLCPNSVDVNCVPGTQSVDLFKWTPLETFTNDIEAYCAVDTSARALDCLQYYKVVGLKSVNLSTVVASAVFQETPPALSEFAGGALHPVLLQQWNAARKIINVVDQLEAAKKVAHQRSQTAQSTINQLSALKAATDAALPGLVGEQANIARRLNDAQAAARYTCMALNEYFRNGHFKVNKIDVDAWKNVVNSDPLQIPEAIDLNARNAGWRGIEGTKWSQISQMSAACVQARSHLDDIRLEAERNGVMVAINAQNSEAGKFAEEAARGQQTSQWLESMGAIVRDSSALDEALATIATSLGELKRLKNEASMAVERANLEATLAANSANLSIGVLRQYHAYDWWRARALLDGARRYAVSARRAIEAHYVTDLDVLTNDEPFVARPASWCDDIYRYDLSLPSAVGLASNGSAATPNAGGDSQYPNAVLDYVGNLERFVQGFAVARPINSAVDSEVVSIPGPGAKMFVDEQFVSDPARAEWSVLCPPASLCTSASSPGWCAVSGDVPIARICEATTSTPTVRVYNRPSVARIGVFLDPWGRESRRGQGRLNARINSRWGRMAMNLVGTGIRDCSGSQKPVQCQLDQFVRYRLEHVGPTLALGATGQWKLMDMPVAQIEAAKASALGELLDLQLNGWGNSSVEAVARIELMNRPMGGAYSLEFELDSTVNFDNVEAVQILYSTNYWVLQR